MSDPAQVLRDFQPKHDFFIGIDSDGCVFDSMEIKHKECFAPMFVKHHNLQAVSKYAREVWDFVNLYSKTRGANRFPALTRALNLLRDRPEVQARNVNVPSYPALDEWMERETKLGNATLAAEVEGGNEGLAHIKVWSDGVNEQVADIVHGVPPFPLLRQTLEKALGQADMMVISQTPCDALERECMEEVELKIDRRWGGMRFLGGWQQQCARDNLINDNFSVFAVKCESEHFKTDGIEIDEARWIPWRVVLGRRVKNERRLHKHAYTIVGTSPDTMPNFSGYNP